MREARFMVHGSQQRHRDLIAGFGISRTFPEIVTVSQARHFHEHSSTENATSRCSLPSCLRRESVPIAVTIPSQAPSKFHLNRGCRNLGPQARSTSLGMTRKG
ncbi:hypothetical protein TIFTF001_038800 [Ficus carica]|uniref:Uncharacterized protein n=1 Tax=Ficus carica TaxID=3494 RepID=A0AA88E8M9_FICCA|nr:hypothetical protein TIFTF001_038800 [Ficus carica]